MSSIEFSWQSLLHTDAPAECSLKAALLTTYDLPDERLLAEHLLPLFLRLSREPDGEGAERQYFLLELDKRLKQLHDRLIVVSSTAREELGAAVAGESGTYGWIWRSIRHLTVGSREKAVQHAKVWLLHWSMSDASGVEYLEVVVSSANLTRAAFQGQLQSAWRACIALRPQRSESRLDGWGVLADFLRELAKSAGDETRLDPFVELLARADCPEGVTFVASVPGTHSSQTLRRTPWGAAGLGTIKPPGQGVVSFSVLAPYVGSWRPDSLSRLCNRFGGAPHRVELVWIDKHHPWASQWLLPKATLRALAKVSAAVLHLRHEPDQYWNTEFHPEHRPEDPRWSHAKVYSFTRGRSRRVLLTSANFSQAAWGTETLQHGLTIENFELGVCVEQATWPFGDLEVFESHSDVATVSNGPVRGAALITWARAVWNGRAVAVDCRCESGREPAGAIKSAGRCIPITAWTVSSEGFARSAQVAWADANDPPSLIRLTCGSETLSVPVFDERPPLDREDLLPPEVDESLACMMRDELLFEQYGGRVANDPEGQDPVLANHDPEDGDGDAPGQPDSYAVPAFTLARQHLSIVDNWADKVSQSTNSESGEFERDMLRRDGEQLIEAFKRQAERDGKHESASAIGARLAAEELIQRLKHFREA